METLEGEGAGSLLEPLIVSNRETLCEDDKGDSSREILTCCALRYTGCTGQDRSRGGAGGSCASGGAARCSCGNEEPLRSGAMIHVGTVCSQRSLAGVVFPAVRMSMGMVVAINLVLSSPPVTRLARTCWPCTRKLDEAVDSSSPTSCKGNNVRTAGGGGDAADAEGDGGAAQGVLRGHAEPVRGVPAAAAGPGRCRAGVSRCNTA